MSIGDVLIIMGCVAVGYWVVSSVLSPGIDLRGQTRPDEPRQQRRPGQLRHEDSALRVWYLVLDVQPDASPAEIRAALKRRLAHAESVGDMDAIRHIAQAAEQALKSRLQISFRMRARPTSRT